MGRIAQTLGVVALELVLALGLAIIPLSAQGVEDCGQECVNCGDLEFEGRDYHPELGENKMDCDGEHGCEECEQPPLVSDGAVGTPDLLRAIQQAAASDLPDVVREHGHRLLLNVDRQLLVIQGGRCATEALGGLYFLNAAQTRVLQKLGVRSLEDFLRQEALLATGRQ